MADQNKRSAIVKSSSVMSLLARSSPTHLNNTVKYPPTSPVQVTRQTMGSLAVFRRFSDLGDTSFIRNFGNMHIVLISTLGDCEATSLPLLVLCALCRSFLIASPGDLGDLPGVKLNTVGV